jgi:hypothetical protein
MRKVTLSIIALLAALTFLAIGLNSDQHESIALYFSQMTEAGRQVVELIQNPF